MYQLLYAKAVQSAINYLKIMVTPKKNGIHQLEITRNNAGKTQKKIYLRIAETLIVVSRLWETY